MLKGEYLKAKKISEQVAAGFAPPLFYRDKKSEMASSKKLFENNDMVKRSLGIVEERQDRVGHGGSHVTKVAIDAGAIVLVENGGIDSEKNIERMVSLAHLAGVLHDIKREEPEHAEKGAVETERLLKDFDVGVRERNAIVQSIRNHEAFKPVKPLEEPSFQIISDALYDADKFRWGPDNFTDTVWLMVANRKVPLKTLLKHFIPGMEGVKKIVETFRTPTGKKYGPDFISRGLDIGHKIYEELKKG